jgi:hypothetical protein
MNDNKRLVVFVSVFTVMVLFSLTTQSLAFTLLEKPYTFTSGEPAYATQVNLNFDKLYNQVNLIGSAIEINKDNGNIGIGTSNPQYNLDISILPTDNNKGIFFRKTNSNMGTLLKVDGTNNQMFTIDIDPTNSTSYEQFQIRYNGNITVLMIDDNKRVGIGTTNPSSFLHVKGNPAIGIESSKLSNPIWYVYYNANSKEDYGLVFKRGDKCILRLGNVTGTKSVMYQDFKIEEDLEVNGEIIHKGINLNADYVFDSDYKLESIEDHANEMFSKGHLKAVPKAKQDENGQDVVEYGSHLRGILEELEKAHIYIHKLNETIKQQQQVIANLSERVSDLEK